MSINTKNFATTRKTDENKTVEQQQVKKLLINRVLRRLGMVIGLALLVSAVATGGTVFLAREFWGQAALMVGTVTFICAMAAIYLGYQIIADPAKSMKTWVITMYVHFVAFFGIAALTIVAFGFNEKVVIIAGLAPTMVFVFGNAWVVQALVTMSQDQSKNKQQLITPDIEENSSVGAGGLDGQIAEAQL